MEDSNFRKTNYMQSTVSELDQIKSEQDFEMMFQRSYYHMLDRMKKDLIATQIKANELQESYKQK